MSKVVDWSAEERKLSSVYEDIQYKRYKVADQTVARWLKKHPKSQPGIVLRMVIQERTGSSEKAILKTYGEAKKAGPILGRSGMYVAITFRNMRRLDLVLKYYEELWESCPDIAETGEQVYLSAAALGDAEAMLKAARKMFNVSKAPIWARATAFSQWLSVAPQPTTAIAFPAPAPEKSLAIASMLLKTTEKEVASADVFWLRLQVLLSNGEDREAWKYATSEGEDGALTRLWHRMEAVKVIGERWKGEDLDQVWRLEWEWSARMLKSSEHIGKKERAPMLALLELEMRVRNAQNNGKTDEEWVEMVKVYWERWGSKGSCVTEIEGVIGGDEPRLALVLELLMGFCERKHSDLKSYFEVVHSKVFVLRNGPKAADSEVPICWGLYKEGLVYGKNLPKTDVQPADEIGLVAIHLLLEQWRATPKDESLVFRSICCLEHIVGNSPSSAHARYLLIRTYRLIGAPTLLHSHLTAIKPAEIQHDNLMHSVFERGSSDVVSGKLQKVWSDQSDLAEAMYKRSAVDLPEFVKQALENESYSKVHSIRILARSLSTSLSSRVLQIEQARLESLVSGTIPDLSGLADDSSPGTDLRNYELVPEIGGQYQDLAALTSTGKIDDTWVRAMSGLLNSVQKFVQDEKIDVSEFCPAEAEVFGKVVGLLRKADSVLEESEKVDFPVSGLFDGKSSLEGKLQADEMTDNIELCLSAKDSGRWEQLYACTTLLELSRMVENILKYLQELAKPVRGKKKPSKDLTLLVGDFKAAQQEYKDKIGAVAEKLDRVVEQDQAINWSRIGNGMLEDDVLVEIGKRITDARISALNNLKNLIVGKKA
ncbi:N-terminal acetyltransferase B complex non-catalytic subunit, partial [Tremellales sp. Uapishka_1]